MALCLTFPCLSYQLSESATLYEPDAEFVIIRAVLQERSDYDSMNFRHDAMIWFMIEAFAIR